MPKGVNHRDQSITPNAKPNGHSYARFVGNIRIIQYRSYKRDIYIYHVRRHLLTLFLICRVLQSHNAYRDKLTSSDPIHYSPVVDGDDVPPGCIEAAYMPSILHGHGSALALRSNKETGRVDWFVFSGPIHDTFLSQIFCIGDGWHLQPGLEADDPRKVFDLVGYAEKGLETTHVRGANREHKGWHDSLCSAEEGKRKLRLTWRRYDELRVHQEWREREATIEGAEE